MEDKVMHREIQIDIHNLEFTLFTSEEVKFSICQLNNKNIQSEKIIRKRVIHKLLEVLYGIIKLGAVEKKSIKLSLNNKYMQAMLLEENNFYNTDFKR